MDPDLLRKRILARLEATGKKRIAVSQAIGKGRDYVSNFLNGEKDSIAVAVLTRLAAELECSPDYFLDPEATPDGVKQGGADVLIPIRGVVGDTPDGRVQMAPPGIVSEFALLPPGATGGSVALKVTGYFLRGVADDGALIFYEQTEAGPTPDMLGHVAVVCTEAGDVHVRRVLKGSHKGVYDLESLNGERQEDMRLRWAAHIISIVPPFRARQILRRLAA